MPPALECSLSSNVGSTKLDAITSEVPDPNKVTSHVPAVVAFETISIMYWFPGEIVKRIVPLYVSMITSLDDELIKTVAWTTEATSAFGNIIEFELDVFVVTWIYWEKG